MSNLEDVFENTDKAILTESPQRGPLRGRSAPKPLKYMCTIVSLLPYEVFEEKPHILPGSFRIPAAAPNDIAILHIGEGIHYIPNAFDDRNYKQSTSPNEMARSLVDDYKSAHIALAEGAEPGLFYLEGAYTKEEVWENFQELISEARVKQIRWFQRLIAMADADWEKNHNMLAVSDLQRIAAKSLNIQKSWVDLVASAPMDKCKFCGFLISPDAVKCVNCKEIVNVEAYKKLTQGAA